MTNKQAYAGLLPCPFCGGEAALYEGHRDHWKVRCTKCEAMRGRWFAREGAQSKAIEAWNTRPEAAEAISSLLKRVGELEGVARDALRMVVEIDELGTYSMSEYRDLRAALNSDAPLSIGEGL